jgi:hypothetical protein
MAFTAKEVDGRRLCDCDRRTVGRVTALYRYPAELNAPWGVAAVTSGSFIRSTHLVDLHDAKLDAGTLVVPYPLETIRNAPNYRAMIGDTLSKRDAAHVLGHYRGTPEPGLTPGSV